jgi:hypothetical protein
MIQAELVNHITARACGVEARCLNGGPAFALAAKLVEAGHSPESRFVVSA